MRKAALCHIQQREYATAASDIRHCASNEAATHYVTLLVAVHQGNRICYSLFQFSSNTTQGLEDEGEPFFPEGWAQFHRNFFSYQGSA